MYYFSQVKENLPYLQQTESESPNDTPGTVYPGPATTVDGERLRVTSGGVLVEITPPNCGGRRLNVAT